MQCMCDIDDHEVIDSNHLLSSCPVLATLWGCAWFGWHLTTSVGAVDAAAAAVWAAHGARTDGALATQCLVSLECACLRVCQHGLHWQWVMHFFVLHYSLFWLIDRVSSVCSCCLAVGVAASGVLCTCCSAYLCVHLLRYGSTSVCSAPRSVIIMTGGPNTFMHYGVCRCLLPK
jgi:hypothetical protein